MNVSFGEFVVDTDQRRVFAGGREVHLARKAFDLLKVLLENRPKALTKDELISRVWPDTAVSENNLATLITDLRTAFGDDPRSPRWIRTVYGYGYAFAAEAIERCAGDATGAGESEWVLVADEKEIALHEGANILGRTAGITALDAPSVSRRHARVAIVGEQVLIEDLESKNGTWVGHAPVTGPTVLREGDEIRLGSIVLVLRRSSRVVSTETVDPPGA
jgi:DNA-binding winged helix-turn-helix (wHTH) protein